MAPLWPTVPSAGRGMLVSPAHPAGFCPTHCCESGARCGVGCVQTRIEFAAAAVALAMYWDSPHRRMYEKERFGWGAFEVSGAA